MNVLVCWKWVALDGDDRWAGVSPADQAALEVALRLMDGSGGRVTVATAGPRSAEGALREALAAGATDVVRIDAPTGLLSDAVAVALSELAAGSTWVVCGDYSLDRGSGAVPALIAAHTHRAQALGLVDVRAERGRLRVVRRLDAGRREELLVDPPAVISVEGAVARLRRASLPAELAAHRATVPVVAGPDGPLETTLAAGPYRPRARVLPALPGDDTLARIRAVTAAGVTATRGDTLTLDPPAAAARIVAALREWGYLAPEPDGTR